MRQGKLDPEHLASLLASLPTRLQPSDDRVVLGPGPGRDAAVVRLPDRYLVLAADPISFAPAGIGAAAVHVNANDVVCLGADPRFFLATILLPPDTDPIAVDALFQDLREACAAVGALLVGGHTEVSDAVVRPVIAGTMVGEAPLDRLYRSDATRPGDALIQVGRVAIEGTALLAHQARARLRSPALAAALREPEIAAAAALIEDPGISVVAAARACWGQTGLHALHDPTEGGIASACWEMAASAGLGLELHAEAILCHPATARIAAALDLDWLGLLASGSLLCSVDRAHAGPLLAHLQGAGYSAARIGGFRDSPGPSQATAILVAPDGSRALPRFHRDEALRVLTREP